jgi:hypothetical protein
LLCLQALDIQGAVPSGSHPRQLAGQLLSLMGAFTRDIATVHNILDSLYEYLDERHRWQERGIVQVGGCRTPYWLAEGVNREVMAAAALMCVGGGLDSFYEYLDKRHRWQELGIVQVGGGLFFFCRRMYQHVVS